jgi:hypothetical protein
MAFYLCEAIKEVTFAARSRLELIEDSAFGSCDKLGPVVVPGRAEIKGKVKVLEVVITGRVDAPQNSVSALLMLK